MNKKRFCIQMPFGETIAALSTPPGESALALIRVSGTACVQIATDALSAPYPTPPPRQASLAKLRSTGGDLLDEVVYTYFAAPASYTGEDMLEISCHGSPYIVQKILSDLVDRGCRLAEPGEFTRTAFMNGKIDLSQAEAVADVIAARSQSALTAAQKQLSGSLGGAVKQLVDNVLKITANIEAYIDFPEDDLPPEDVDGPLQELAKVEKKMRAIAETQHYYDLLHKGIKTVILGAPNAGKSSLLNTLSGEDRVIVTDVPGTTRDTVEECIMAGDYLLRIIDTAGLHETEDQIERLGIQRSIKAAQQGDFFLIVLDSAAPSPTLPGTVIQYLSPSNTIVVENKIDLPASSEKTDFLPEYTHSKLSLKDGKGLDVLRGTIQDKLKALAPPSGEAIVVNERHSKALTSAADSLAQARQLLGSGEPPELGATLLHEAIEHLGAVTGKIDNEAMLDQLFANFCIGK